MELENIITLTVIAFGALLMGSALSRATNNLVYLIAGGLIGLSLFGYVYVEKDQAVSKFIEHKTAERSTLVAGAVKSFTDGKTLMCKERVLKTNGFFSDEYETNKYVVNSASWSLIGGDKFVKGGEYVSAVWCTE